MSGGLTGAGEIAALNYLTGRSLDLGVSPQTMQLALLTAPPPANPAVSDLTEVVATGYARQNVSWSAAVNATPGQPSVISNSANILYGPFTAVGGLNFPATHCALIGNVVAGSTANLLTANQSEIETDASAWTSLLNASLVQSTAQAHSGTHSLAVTSTPAAGDTQVTTAAKVAAVPYRVYTASGWVYTVASGSQAKTEIAFYDSSNALIQRITGSFVSLPASTWTQFSFSAMAPANTANAAPILHSNPTASGAVTYWDSMSVAATVDVTVLMTWNFDVAGTAAQNESLQISAGALAMDLG